MANSFLHVTGLYNPSARYAFTNITDEDFTSFWDKIPITVKPHETIELSITTPIPGVNGQALAVKMTGELVDFIMINEAKADELAHKDIPYYRSPKGSSLGIPGARKPYEDQILKELAVDEESPAIQSMRKQLKEEILGGSEQKQSVEPPPVPSQEEFAEIKAVGNKEPEVIKKPAKTRKLHGDEIADANSASTN